MGRPHNHNPNEESPMMTRMNRIDTKGELTRHSVRGDMRGRRARRRCEMMMTRGRTARRRSRGETTTRSRPAGTALVFSFLFLNYIACT
jgi:hypothetical protein